MTAGAVAASNGTWFPFQASFLARAVVLLFLAAIAFPVSASAAALKPETVAAWDQEVRAANARSAGASPVRRQLPVDI